MSDDLVPPDISAADWQATPVGVQVLVQQLLQQMILLQEQLRQSQARIAQLEERLKQNSRNSSKPPSSDPPQTPARPPRPVSGRKAGGQAGHPGHHRVLKVADQVVVLRPVACAHCHALLLGDDSSPERHQVSELPRIEPRVTEYQRHTLTCVCCGQRTSASWPADMPVGDFGPRVQAMVGYLSGRQSLSHRDIVEVCDTLLNIDLSLGSVTALEHAVSAAVAPAVADAQHYVQQQPAVHVDETGWFEQAQRRWLWLAATPLVSFFLIRPTRGRAGLLALLGETFAGLIHSDRWSAYNASDPQRRQLCWAHLVRDFQKLVERGGASQALGADLLATGQRLFERWEQFQTGQLSRGDLQTAVDPLRPQVHAWLQAGATLDHPQTRHLCQNLLKLEVALWTFVAVDGLQPTNNLAERNLRRAVLWRRRSFGSQSEAGSAFVARILTVVTTLRQQHRDVLDYLTAACAAANRHSPPPSLLPIQTT